MKCSYCNKEIIYENGYHDLFLDLFICEKCLNLILREAV